MAKHFYIDVVVEGGNPALENEIERILEQRKAGSCDEEVNRRVTFYYSDTGSLQLSIVRLSRETEFFISVEFGRVPHMPVNQ